MVRANLLYIFPNMKYNEFLKLINYQLHDHFAGSTTPKTFHWDNLSKNKINDLLNVQKLNTKV